MLLAGCIAAVLAWWFLRSAATSDPKRLARLARRGGGIAALAVAAVLGARGRLDMAFLAGGVGAWLLEWNAGLGGWLRQRTGLGAKPAGAVPVSRTRSASIELVMDEAGRVGGTILSGPGSGRSLDDLDLAELLDLRRACSGRDPQGRQLVEHYLDSRAPRWREDAEGDPDARRRSDPERSPMSEQEAHEILGLQLGADAESVRTAHRTLMKKLHPDQGGSTYLASRVNQAKDVLLDRHR